MCEKQYENKAQFYLQRESLEGLELVPTYLKISQLLLLRYDEFLDLIKKFNEKLKLFTENEPDFIHFSIVPESGTTMLWKLFIRVTCSRISRTNKTTSDEVILSLNQFLSVYQSLTQQLLILEQNPSNELFNSTTQQVYPSLSTRQLSLPAFDTNECCICMDHQSNLVLPCTHKICDECFQRWSAETSAAGCQTCPICRSDISSTDGFILAEMPKSDSVKKTIMESLLALPVEYKKTK